MKKKLKVIWELALVLMIAMGITGCKAKEPAEPEETVITVLATSDLHGKLFPWDYVSDQEDKSGSMFQLANAVKANYAKDSTLLVDAGDTVQDNFAEIFLQDEIHPMMKMLNEIGYDLWTTGNHEYDFGMDITERLIREFEGHAIVSNLYGPDGKRMTEPYAIFEKKGVRIAVLCMVTPNIARWNPKYLAGYTVTNPIDETRLLLKELEGKYDILLGVNHMGFEDENEVEGSGVRSYLKYFPEFDAVIASHEHKMTVKREVYGILVVENAPFAASVMRIDFTMTKGEDGWEKKDTAQKTIMVSEYEPDEAMMREYRDCDRRIREYFSNEIGTMHGDAPLVKEGELKGTELPSAMLEPSALITLYNSVFRCYAETDVSCAAVLRKSINLKPGPLTVRDLGGIYPFPNKLCKVKMNGKQLRKLMEWSAGAYTTFHRGDLTLSFEPGTIEYNYEIFSGVNYEIDVSKEKGSRIVNLTWPDGRPVKDEDEFEAAMTTYRYGSTCSEFGTAFTEEEGLPELIDADVRSDLGGIRGMLKDYVENVLHGDLYPKTENNWRLIGYEWDEDLHARAVDLINRGKLDLENGTRSVTEEDVRQAEAG